jgi:RNA polymerase sigma factor (sigma-70 family)
VEKDVEQAGTVASDNAEQEAMFVERRVLLAQQYAALPPYGSDSFWPIVLLCQTTEQEQVLPLEVLVKVLREAVRREDEPAQRRVIEVMLVRLQRANMQWMHDALVGKRLLPEERSALAADLYADLCELLLRVLRNPQYPFWEENFLHSLRYARQHVYQSLLRRESHWRKLTPGPGKRVPHMLLESWERLDRDAQVDEDLEVRDERAEEALHAVELSDLVAQVLALPDWLRLVVLLTYWEGYGPRTVGRLLNMSEKTVRNRLRIALRELRVALGVDLEVMDGESA